MGERMLRGSRLGAVSYESDRNTELAPRQTREYLCAKGHQFEVPFAVDAEVPITWECGSTAASAGSSTATSQNKKRQSHPERTGTCCWNAVPSRSWRISSTSASTRFALAEAASPLPVSNRRQSPLNILGRVIVEDGQGALTTPNHPPNDDHSRSDPDHPILRQSPHPGRHSGR